MTLSIHGRVALVAGAGLILGATITGIATVAGLAPWLAVLIGAGIGTPLVVIITARVMARPLKVLRALEDGVDGFNAGDFSLRLAVENTDELGRLAAVYNNIGEVLGQERTDLRQRELMLASVLEASPTAVLLINPVDRVLVANRSARRLFGEGRSLDGRTLTETIDTCPTPLRDAIECGREGLVTIGVGGAEESYQFTRQSFELNTRHYLLLQIRNVTPQLRRQEVAVWKKVVRVVGHEINNALTPIRSLVGTGRRLVESGDPTGHLPEVLEAIDDSATHLHHFVDGYRTVARLPAPQPEAVDIRRFLEHLQELEPFDLAPETPAITATFDPAQMQQVVLNLVRNAREAGSAETVIGFRIRGDDLELQVADRGSGMDEEAMLQAVLPFWSTKESGSGVGLALCREIAEAHHGSLQMAPRDGGGLVVTILLPGVLVES
ncbi:MAG: PAS domain-containing protein [bacterium]|nr:PAS domain-containing protein [bacterium]